MRGECFGLPQSFLGIHITVYPCGLLDSKKYVGVFQITYVQLIPQLFLLNFLVSPLFDPKVFHCLWQRQLKYLSGKAFSGIPQVVILTLEGILSQVNKKKLFEKIFQGNTNELGQKASPQTTDEETEALRKAMTSPELAYLWQVAEPVT